MSETLSRGSIRGGYRFQPAKFWPDSPVHFEVRRKRSRDSSPLAIIYPASDGVCWSVSVAGQAYDARPSLRQACDLVMARLPIEGRDHG